MTDLSPEDDFFARLAASIVWYADDGGKGGSPEFRKDFGDLLDGMTVEATTVLAVQTGMVQALLELADPKVRDALWQAYLPDGPL